MRVAILSQYYSPEIGAPQARLSALASALRDRGHDVFVLTAFPNYPTGHLYEGYGGLFASEVIEGVRVFRSWVYPTISKWMPSRLFGYLSFAVSALFNGLVRLPRVDYLVTESPPLSLAPIGLLLAKTKRARWILNVSDLWPDSIDLLGVRAPGSLMRAARALERFSYRRAWLVTGQTKGIIEAVATRSPRTSVRFFPNGVDTRRFVPGPGAKSASSSAAANDACNFVYAGLHGLAQGLDQILEALAVVDRPEVRVTFIGDGPEKTALLERSKRLGLKTVRFMDPIPHDEVPAALSRADVALVPLRIPIAEAVPSKLYEALAAGLPVLLISRGEAERLIEEAGAGVTVQPGDIDGLAGAMRFLADEAAAREEMSSRGRDFVARRFDRKRINDELIDFLEAQGSPQRPAP